MIDPQSPLGMIEFVVRRPVMAAGLVAAVAGAIYTAVATIEKGTGVAALAMAAVIAAALGGGIWVQSAIDRRRGRGMFVPPAPPAPAGTERVEDGDFPG